MPSRPAKVREFLHGHRVQTLHSELPRKGRKITADFCDIGDHRRNGTANARLPATSEKETETRADAVSAATPKRARRQAGRAGVEDPLGDVDVRYGITVEKQAAVLEIIAERNE